MGRRICEQSPMVLENREGPGEPRAVDGRGPDELEGQADLLFCGSTQATPLPGQGDAEQVRLGLVGDQRRRHRVEFHHVHLAGDQLLVGEASDAV